MKAQLARLQIGVNVAGAALLLWLTLPLLAINGQHPFEGRPARAGALLGVALLALLAWAIVEGLRRRRNLALFAHLQGDGTPASAALAERFGSAMHLLRAGIAVEGKVPKRFWQRRRHVYQLPWYVFIGAPGAGKTTALLHSGLRFPLAERLGAAPVAGIGGTRQCDWWFTDRAVFIDTAGRYTTQDSHAASDAEEWQTFLHLLRRYRPVQPINGVIVTVSIPDLLLGGAELEHQASAVDQRLHELRTRLGLSFPVYLLVSKADLLAGFVEFFGDFDAARREQVWGISFDLTSNANGAELPSDLLTRLAALPERIAALRAQRLQEEPVPQRRAAIYHFAAQVEAVLPALEGYARRAFRRSADLPHQPVRSINFSSGTQEGNPIDRVLGELSRSYGMALRTVPRPDAGGKAYFLATLLQRLVIDEAPLAGTSLQRRRRRRLAAAAAAGLSALVLVLACGGWWISYQHNIDYVDGVHERVAQVTRQIDPHKAGNIDQLLPLYAMLGHLAESGGVDPARAPFGFGFGLFQGPRLAQSADQTYHQVLDRTLAPLLAQRLSAALRQTSDPAARYEALRIGLMMVTPGKLQRDEVRRWAAQAFAAPAMPAAAASAASASTTAGGQAPAAGEQQEWLRHLDALLERSAVPDAVLLDAAVVRSARTALIAVPMEQRVHGRLMRRAGERLGGEQTLAELASPSAVLAFAPADAPAGEPSIPAIYTRQAWRDLIEPAIDPTIAELTDEAGWVLDDRSPGLQRLLQERPARDDLARQVALLHARAAQAQWNKLLAALALQVPSDAQALARLGTALAAPTSPLRELLRRVATEFPAPAEGAAGRPAAVAFDNAMYRQFGVLADYARSSGAGAIDRLLRPLPAVLREPAAAPATELARELRAEAGRAPQPVREIWSGLAEALGMQQRRALARQLSGGIAELSESCRRLTAERFPFVATAVRDMPFADFARLLGPHGLLDTYFSSHLAARVDTSTRPWRLRGEAGAPSGTEAAVLKAFEAAQDIRQLFFPAGAELPQLRLRLTPLSMDGELLLFSADVDGQLLRYENGPRRTTALVWPGPAATQRVVLRILPAGPSGVGAEVHEGPWALLRVLQRRGWRGGDAASQVVELEVDGRALKLELSTDASIGPGPLGRLGGFRCPE